MSLEGKTNMDEKRDIVKAVGNLHTPKKAGDVGYDLEATEDKFCPKGYIEWIPVGVNVQMPNDLWCYIVGRSSMGKEGCLIIQGIIDSGYTGPLFVGLISTQKDITIKKGQRIAQVIFAKAERPEIKQVSSIREFESTERGGSGFGSTGKE